MMSDAKIIAPRARLFLRRRARSRLLYLERDTSMNNAKSVSRGDFVRFFLPLFLFHSLSLSSRSCIFIRGERACKSGAIIEWKELTFTVSPSRVASSRRKHQLHMKTSFPLVFEPIFSFFLLALSVSIVSSFAS